MMGDGGIAGYILFYKIYLILHTKPVIIVYLNTPPQASTFELFNIKNETQDGTI